MTLPSVLILAAVAALFFLALRYAIRTGGCAGCAAGGKTGGCSGHCAGCTGACGECPAHAPVELHRPRTPYDL